MTKKILLVTLTGLVIASIGIIILVSIQSLFFPFAFAADAKPDDSKELKALVLRYYEIRGRAARDFDVSAFHTIYVDDSHFRLTKVKAPQVARLSRVTPEIDPTKGELSFNKSWYTWWGKSANFMEARYEAAKAVGRDINKEDVDARNQAELGDMPRRTDPVELPNIQYKSIKVMGDLAEVIYIAIPQTQSQIMVRTKEGWRIAASETIAINP